MKETMDVNSENINNFVPSVLNPRAVRRRTDDLNFSQLSTTSRFSLSLRKKTKVFQDISNSQCVNSPLKLKCKLRNQSVDSSSPMRNPLTVKTEGRITQNQNSPTNCTRKVQEEEELSFDFADLYDTVYSQKMKEPHNSEPKQRVETPSTFKIDEADRQSNKSINSCTTQFYDPCELTSCGSQHSSALRESSHTLVTANKVDDKIVLKCKLNNNIKYTNEPTKRMCDSQPYETKRKKIESISDDDSVIVVLSSTAVKEYSQIVVTPPTVAFVKRNSTKLKCQQKITTFLNYQNPSHIIKKVSSYDNLNNKHASVSFEDILCVNGTTLEPTDLDKTLQIIPEKESIATHKPSDVKYGSTVPLTSKGNKYVPLSTSQCISKSSSKKQIPPHKVMPGTQIAVDAFNYGNIPNVKHYFLTHFHSDHYTGLRKSFNSRLYCTRITADLCISQLGVNSKYITIINIDKTILVDDVKVTAIDANHCPGSMMLLFSLSDGKNILHCGDFRASHEMESHPIFWNIHIHTVYLDTTYCNPRHNFPSQHESVDMAVNILEQKRIELQKIHRDFSKVLVVCGTYTIGKENFFIGLSKFLDCTVWADTEKAGILRTVLGRSFNQSSKTNAKIHVLNMRYLTYHDLKLHLESMEGVFSEIVAFKPSGWQFGNRTAFKIDNVTIHNIPYSEHSSFPEMIRFVKFLRPNLVIPTVPVRGGFAAVQKYFPCPVVTKESEPQKRISDFFTVRQRKHAPPVT